MDDEFGVRGGGITGRELSDIPAAPVMGGDDDDDRSAHSDAAAG